MLDLSQRSSSQHPNSSLSVARAASMSEEPTPRGEESLQQDTELEQAKPEAKVEDTEPKIEVEAEAHACCAHLLKLLLYVADL